LNEIELDTDDVALFASDTYSGIVLEGTHSAYLQAWFTGNGVSISQAGDVPAATSSIRFLARNPYYAAFPFPPGVFDLRLNGESIPLVPLGSTSDGEVLDVMYAGDASGWAGANADLRISVFSGYPGRVIGWAVLDAISFSPEPIPEPIGGGGFVGLMGALSTRRRRCARRGRTPLPT
jgi:hypothetical protein